MYIYIYTYLLLLLPLLLSLLLLQSSLLIYDIYIYMICATVGKWNPWIIIMDNPTIRTDPTIRRLENSPFLNDSNPSTEKSKYGPTKEL